MVRRARPLKDFLQRPHFLGCAGLAFGAVFMACGGRANSFESDGSGGSAISGSNGGAAGAALNGAAGTGIDAGGSVGAVSGGTHSGGSGLAGANGGGPVGGKASTLPGTDGPVWRQSPSPFCVSTGDWNGDLWSDERGVYVLGPAEQGRSVFFNGGSGWSLFSTPQLSASPYRIGGFDQGPVLVFAGAPCGIEFIDDHGVGSCSAAAYYVQDVFTVHETLAYAVVGNRVLRYNGSYWTQLGSPIGLEDETRALALWATADFLAVGTSGGGVFIYRSGSAEPELLELESRSDVLSLWGFGPDDLWLGDADGQLSHYDGQKLTRVAVTGEDDCNAVRELWGADGTLYFATSNHVGRWRDQRIDSILYAPCSQRGWDTLGRFDEVSVHGLWGNSPDEVFFGLQESTFVVTATEDSFETTFIPPEACSGTRLYWFDGLRLGVL